MKIIAAVTVALLARPIAAHAGPHCGGGSDGGSSVRDHRESSSSSTNETSWSAPHSGSTIPDAELATGSTCEDNTDVVGFRKCTKFGRWGMNTRLPRFFVELGTNMRQFSSGLGDQTGHVSHGSESFAFRTVMPTGGSTATPHDTAMMTSTRIGVGLPHGLYAGGEVELGGLVSPAAATAEMMTTGTFGAPDVAQGHGMVIGGLGFVGVRNTTGRASFALEGGAGARSVRYSFDSAYHECLESTTIVVTHAVVEARARAELWLNPWLTAGASLGSNMLARGDWMAGLYFGVHTRAFGGGR